MMNSERPFAPEDSRQIVYSESDVEILQRIGTVLTVPKHTTLCRAGTVPDCCFYILEGEVESFDNIISGNERIFRRSTSGSTVLLPAMVVRHELFLSFRTTKQSKLIKISGDKLQEFFLEAPDFAARTIREVSALYLQTIEQFWVHENYNLSWRLCNLLIDLAAESGVDYDGKVMISRSLSQQEMAALLQSSRVSVARAFKKLKDLGLIEYTNGFYCIRSIERLKHHMAYLEEI